MKSWERAKIGLKSIRGDCRIDLSELSQMPLEVEMDDMDRGRTMKNRGGEVRFRGIRKKSTVCTFRAGCVNIL